MEVRKQNYYERVHFPTNFGRVVLRGRFDCLSKRGFVYVRVGEAEVSQKVSQQMVTVVKGSVSSGRSIFPGRLPSQFEIKILHLPPGRAQNSNAVVGRRPNLAIRRPKKRIHPRLRCCRQMKSRCRGQEKERSVPARQPEVEREIARDLAAGFAFARASRRAPSASPPTRRSEGAGFRSGSHSQSATQFSSGQFFARCRCRHGWR